MLTRQSIESLLKANGIPPTAPDEEIRSVLISARFAENDVDTALLVLKENKVTSQAHVDTLHKVFHSDERLSPADISSLLGIEVNFTHKGAVANTTAAKEQRWSSYLAVLLAFVIVAIGVTYLTRLDPQSASYEASPTNRNY
ncbi:MAG: hypothetical protein RLZZ70_670 [Candidatus Parcubacteria bacterium]|jgi:nitric oxide reductase large subunit